MAFRRICVLGGTGFVGRHLVCELSRRGYTTRVVTRRRERHRSLLVFPTCEVVEGNVHDLPELTDRMRGCDATVNLVGILNERGREGDTFAAAHAELPAKVGEACRFNRISRLLHMSALRAGESGPSEYLKTKHRGEEAIHAWANESLQVTTFRPSVIFGPDDDFFNRFAALLVVTPWLFPLACARSRFAPVYVRDVARAFADSLENEATHGVRYNLCGPRVYSLHELVAYTAEIMGLRRRVVGLSDRLSRAQARVLERVPGKPFSTDNYLSLQVDSVCEEGPGFDALGIEPTNLEAVVPTYLGTRGRQGRYARFRAAAGRS